MLPDGDDVTTNDVMRQGFEACMRERTRETGKKTNPRTLGLEAGRPSSALYAWLNGKSGISLDTLDGWLEVLGVSNEVFWQRCIVISRPQ
jgi:hypothetical protein